METYKKVWLANRKPIQNKMTFRGDKVAFEVSKNLVIVRRF